MTTPSIDTTTFEWVPLGTGLSFEPLRFFADDSGYRLLLRIEPGTTVAPHRHTGEIHAYDNSGSRRIITTGDVIGPGTYVDEPVGNEDSREAVGESQGVGPIRELIR